jgi:hypothetical protein
VRALSLFQGDNHEPSDRVNGRPPPAIVKTQKRYLLKVAIGPKKQNEGKQAAIKNGLGVKRVFWH